ncbi:DJ-1/PfpI family protein [Bordetella sp. LUAb4]|uniref:DJ-1/PfpI family protein n=1 Tax=Bordetella sp. LUAb4 TaxID=2843195 RepID=UPI001E2DBC57|nr:DJ-1/PfpI family protein [Bordetella sp. LUAb4]
MRANFALFEGVTQLDLTGPYEVLARAPGFQCDLVAKGPQAVRSDRGLMLVPTTTVAEAGPCDLLVVPGGPGTDAALQDPVWVDFVRTQAASAKWVFGICTGSLLLGAAGLLKGRRASCHWLARDLLAEFGAQPVDDRTTIDGKYFTSGGVTAGIDMALLVVANILDRAAAEQIQLQIEYDPAPPFPGGTLFTSRPEIVQRCMAASAVGRASRAAAVKAAAAKLGSETQGGVVDGATGLGSS